MKAHFVEVCHCLENDGFAIVDRLLSEEDLRNMRAACAGIEAIQGKAGLRQALARLPAMQAALRAGCIPQLVAELLPGAFPVRTILFDKTPEANWGVPWHQDVTICVEEKAEMEGYGPWSVKNEVVHVQPPVEVLARMVTLRVHLDDCDDTNGPLKVLPGSHRHGRLTAGEIAALKKQVKPIPCHVPAGGAVLMKPLLVHGSAPAQQAAHRRVLHIEWAADPLPAPLRWAHCG